MALLVVCRVGDESGEARLEIEYDETSDSADWDLIQGRVVNGMRRPCFVLMQRGNGQSWLERQVDAESIVSEDAGGPMRRMSDLARIMLVTR